MSDERPDDDEYWRRVREADDVREPPRHEDANVKTDPDEVRGWAEERDAVPVADLNASGPGAYALRHENVVDGSAHERVSWEDFVAAFRDEDMAFHHDEDEAGTHRFVRRSDVDEHMSAEGVESEPDTMTHDTDADRGVAGTAEDEGRTDPGRDDHAGEPEPDIGASETETTDMETGTETTTGTGRSDAETDRGETDATADRTGAETGTTSDVDVLADVSEGDSVVDAEGETVGIVTAVETGEIYVDPDPGLTEKLSAKLGWVDEDDAEYTVDADDVADVEDGDVRLKPVTL